jgi:cupin 2 domain-containing protein
LRTFCRFPSFSGICILANPHFRIERIVSLGRASPDGFWYDQEEHEWVLLVKGAARLRFEDNEPTVEMKPGSFINIPAHKRHRVAWTAPNQPTIWLAVHYREEP